MRGRDFFVVGVVMSLRAVAGAGASRPRSVTGEYGGMVWSIPQSALPGLCESDGLLFRGLRQLRVLRTPVNHEHEGIAASSKCRDFSVLCDTLSAWWLFRGGLARSGWLCG